jgi:hypothetical protein
MAIHHSLQRDVKRSLFNENNRVEVRKCIDHTELRSGETSDHIIPGLGGTAPE